MQKNVQKNLMVAIAAMVIVGVGYAVYASVAKQELPLRYVLGTVSKGTLVSSISGTGQVDVTDKIEVKPKASGELTYLGVKVGQQVKAGTVIGRVNASAALKAVRDAASNLETAKLQLEKIKAPPDDLSMLQAENAMTQLNKTRADAVVSLSTAYDDGFTDVSDAFLNLPSVMTGLEQLIHGTDFNDSNWNIDGYTDAIEELNPGAMQLRNDVQKKYDAARDAYESNFQQYSAVSRGTDSEIISALITRTAATAGTISDAVKSLDNLIRYYQDATVARGIAVKAVSDQHLAKLAGYAGTVNQHLATTLAATRNIKSSSDAIQKADRDLAEREKTNENLIAPPDALDLKSQELVVRQRQDALADARSNLADYSIVSPFDGLVADVAVKLHDQVSSSTVIVTVVTQTKTVAISLNEIDASKVQVGQKATLTFDAVEDLVLTGIIASIDTLGTASQGVVSYGVVIALDAEDEHLKPGMTASASIITDVSTDALLVPSGAIKTLGDMSYVEIPAGTVPENDSSTPDGIELPAGITQVEVQVGITDGLSTEVLSGLSEGDTLVTRSIDPNLKATTARQTQSIIPGAAGSTRATGAGGNFRGGATGGNAVFIGR